MTATPTIHGWYPPKGEVIKPALFLRGRETAEQALEQARERWGDPQTADRDKAVMFAPWGNIGNEVGFDADGYAEHVADGKMSGWDWLGPWFSEIIEMLDRAGYHANTLGLDIESARADTWGKDTPKIVAALRAGVPGLPDIDPDVIGAWPPNSETRDAIQEWNQWAAKRECASWRRNLLKPARAAWGDDVIMGQYAFCSSDDPVMDDNGWTRPNVAADGRTDSPVLYATAPDDALAWYDAARNRGSIVLPWICGPVYRGREHCLAVYRGLLERGCDRMLFWGVSWADQIGADEIMAEVLGEI